MAKRGRGKTDLPELSRLELAVMGVVWELGDCSSAEVIAAFTKRRRLAVTTIRTVLANLRKKGYLELRSPTDRAAASVACVAPRHAGCGRRPHAPRPGQQSVRRLTAASYRLPAQERTPGRNRTEGDSPLVGSEVGPCLPGGILSQLDPRDDPMHAVQISTTNALGAFLAVIAGHPLLERLFFASVELAVLAVVVYAAIRVGRIRSARLASILWLLVLAKPLVSLAIGSPIPLVRMHIPEVAVVVPALEPNRNRSGSHASHCRDWPEGPDRLATVCRRHG